MTRDLRNVANSAYLALWHRKSILVVLFPLDGRYRTQMPCGNHLFRCEPTLVCTGLIFQALLFPTPGVIIPGTFLITRDDTGRACSRLPWVGVPSFPMDTHIRYRNHVPSSPTHLSKHKNENSLPPPPTPCYYCSVKFINCVTMAGRMQTTQPLREGETLQEDCSVKDRASSSVAHCCRTGEL